MTSREDTANSHNQRKVSEPTVIHHCHGWISARGLRRDVGVDWSMGHKTTVESDG